MVGRTLTIDSESTTVIGVAPADFRIPHGGQILSADPWMPIRFTLDRLSQRRSNYLLLLGRLAPGATVESAESELRGLFANLVGTYPELNGENVRVAPLHSENIQAVRKPLLLLFGAVFMVLLIAATNVAALLLARGVQRRRLGAPALIRRRDARGGRQHWPRAPLGLAGCAVVTRLMTFMLYGTKPLDPLVWTGAAALMVLSQSRQRSFPHCEPRVWTLLSRFKSSDPENYSAHSAMTRRQIDEP